MTEERTKELLESTLALSYQRADEIERLEAERAEFSGYLEQVFVLFDRCNFSEIPERVRGLVEERDALKAKNLDAEISALRLEIGKLNAAAYEARAEARREALEEAAKFIEAPPVGSIHHEDSFKWWGFTPRSFQEDLAIALRALSKDNSNE